jgi:putative transposase
MTMCRALQVTRAGFYAWLHKPLSDRAIEDGRLLGLIRASYAASGGVYGSPRVFADLREAGEQCGKHRVARIMRTHKIRALRGYKRPRPIIGRPPIIAPNTLNREFKVDAPDRVWATDITYLRTWLGWLYLAVVSDDWRRFCQTIGFEPSMSRRGNCWDNTVAESFFSSLKSERVRKRIYKTRELARANVFDYIEVFYNRTRRHSHLGGVSPEAFERASL